MKPAIKAVISAVVLLVLVVAFYYASKTISSLTGKSIFGFVVKDSGSDLDKFAKCLAEDKAELYYNEGCPKCQQQKAIFGSSFQYLDSIECSRYGETCTEKGIEYVPTWIINSRKYIGIQSLEKLSELSGCLL